MRSRVLFVTALFALALTGRGDERPAARPEDLTARPGGDQPQVLLTPARIAALRQKAAQNTPQWQAFKGRLDKGLLTVNGNTYQGGGLEAIPSYALGYRILKDTDARTAADYADKALALMKSALHDYQKGVNETHQFLARGDGRPGASSCPMPTWCLDPQGLSRSRKHHHRGARLPRHRRGQGLLQAWPSTAATTTARAW